MDFLEPLMRPNGRGGSHKKFTGTLEQGTGVDMPIGCAEFITESTQMSQRNAFNKDILNSMVSLKLHDNKSQNRSL